MYKSECKSEQYYSAKQLQKQCKTIAGAVQKVAGDRKTVQNIGIAEVTHRTGKTSFVETSRKTLQEHFPFQNAL